MPIVSSWESYFETWDEGLGTTYERFIINNYFESLREQFCVKSVLEAPSFGMTGVSGINSMWWALNGTKVTIHDNSEARVRLIRKVWKDMSLEAEILLTENFRELPHQDKSFDMSWNFASLWYGGSLDSFLKEMTRVTRTVIFICVPNRHGLGFKIRQSLTAESAGATCPEHLLAEAIKDHMGTHSWKVFQEGYLDTPPWPDIAMKKEELLKKIGLRWLAERLSSGGGSRLCILDYYKGEKPRMKKDILRYSFLEQAPDIIQRNWAHHWYAIFVPQ